ncbi:MAG: PAS domain S-box protein [Elusimicrobiales bacterium]|nr:PAS domain S-box protein [Elusimicrobiales bacterium]
MTTSGILIIEDDLGLRELEKQRLAPLGLQVTCVQGIAEALAASAAGGWDLLLADYSLPGGTALDLLRRLKEAGRPVPPFIVATGRGDEAVAVAAMKAGACDYIIKNADFLDSLLPAVKKALEKAALLRDLEASRVSTAKNLHLYTFLSQVNLAAAYTKDEKALYRKICEVAVTAGELRMAWIGLPDAELGRIVPFCSAGSEDGYLDGIKLLLAENAPSGQGPTGRAAVSGQIRTCADIDSNPAMAPWREKALAHGYRSSAAIPLSCNGNLQAVLSLYSSEPDFFTPDEVRMLEEIKANLSLALEAISAERSRALARADLDRTARQLAHVMDVNPVILFSLKPRGGADAGDWARGNALITEWVSGNVAALTGYSPEEFTRPDWWASNIHPEDREKTVAAQKDILARESLTQDFRFRRKDGAYFWVHSQLKVTPGGSGVTGSWTDITGLKESEARFQELFEKTPVGYLSMDAEGRLLAVNDTWCRVLGRARSEVLGHNLRDYLAQESAGKFPDCFSEFKRGGEMWDVEVEIARPDGARRWLNFSGRVARNADGSFRQTHCVFTDITETREQRKQMRLLMDAVSSSFDEIYIFDSRSFRFIFANQAAFKNLGYTADELHALAPWDLKRDYSEETFKKVVEPLLAGRRRGLVLESAHTRKDGSAYPVELRLQVVEVGEERLFLAVVSDITERKKVADELQRQRRLFSDVLNNSSSFIYALDRDGRFLVANKELAGMYGVRPEEMLGKTRSDFMPPEVAGQHFANDLKIWESGVPGYFEETAPSPGGLRYYYSSKFPLRDKAGGVYAVCGISTDITERKLAEEQARRNEARLEGLARINAYQPRDTQDLLDYALSETILLTGSRLGYIYHYSEKTKQFTLDTWSKEVTRECAVADPQATYKLENSGIWGEVVRQRKPLILNDYAVYSQLKKGLPAGHAKLENFMSVPVFSGDNIVAVVGVANKQGAYDDRDLRQLTLLMDSVWKMVERGETREALAAGEARFKALVDAVPEGIVVRRGREIRYINRGGLAQMRAERTEQLLGRDILERVPEKYHANLLELMRLMDKEGQNTPPVEIEVIALDGVSLDLEISGAPINFAGEDCAVVFFTDISGRKKAERMMRDLGDAQRVESLGALAGGIAHDFNNMLTGIMANLSLLAGRAADPAGKEIIRDVLEAARNAQGLTAQLLAFSRGGKPVKKETCLGKALLEIFSLATRGAKCACEPDISDLLWSVEADENQLKQAVNNLLVNGLQAMPAGGTLRLKAENKELSEEQVTGLPAGKYVRIAVSDTGIGIPAGYLPRLFEPYFTTKAQGHGLGLAMTWSVVANHGGKVLVRSESGKGSEFEIFLPATGCCLKGASQKDEEVAKGHGRILLLEDEEIVQKAAARLLRELGYDCELTADGKETLRRYAEEAAAGRPFDAVIMDLTIPGGMGGKEAGEKLRLAAPKAVIIVSSGYSEEPVMAEFRGYGFDAVLPKPYSYEEMAKVLAKVLQKK